MTVINNVMQKGELFPIIVEIRKKGTNELYDLSGATSKYFVFKSPTGNVKTKECVFFTNGEDGKVVYVLLEGDIDEVGLWSFQADIVWSDSRRKTGKMEFTVEEDLEL